MDCTPDARLKQPGINEQRVLITWNKHEPLLGYPGDRDRRWCSQVHGTSISPCVTVGSCLHLAHEGDQAGWGSIG